MLLLAALLAVAVLTEYASFNKLESLQKQKEIATAVYKLGRKDLDLSNIQYRGQNAILKHESNTLSGFYEYDYINKFSNATPYQKELSKLQKAINDFNIAAGNWYTQDTISQEELKTRNEQFAKSYNLLMAQINKITSDNRAYEEVRFQIQMGLTAALLLLIFLTAIWITGRLSKIQKDIKSLTLFDNDESTSFFTIQADTISKQMGRASKMPAVKNPAYLDGVTGINSYKGFMHEYTEKKSQKLGNYSAVCVFCIDNLNTLEMQYTQEFVESLIKKVSFMLSLYHQHNDIIGRLDHNQFAIFLSRQDKSSAINDCELIRKSVEDTTFKSSDGKNISVTLSGGFVQKLSGQKIDEVLSKANKVLSMSIQHGGNRIAQLRDKSTVLK